MTGSEYSGDAGDRIPWRLPRMGCFGIFFLVLFLLCGLVVTLYHTAFAEIPVWPTPEGRVSVLDPAHVLLDDDLKELRALGDRIAREGRCDVAVLLADEKTADFLDLFHSVAAKWAPGRGVLLVYGLQNDYLRLELLGEGWELTGWDARGIAEKLRIRRKARGRTLVGLLKRLDTALETAKSPVPADSSPASPVLYSHLNRKSEVSAPTMALSFVIGSLLIGWLMLRQGRALRTQYLRTNPGVQKQFEAAKAADPLVTLGDLNAEKHAGRWTHRAGLKVTALILAGLFSLSMMNSVNETPAPDVRASVSDVAAEKPGDSVRVVDKAAVFTAEEVGRLTRAVMTMERRTGGEMMILTVPSTDGVPIEEYSINIASAWKIGKAGKDNGALLVLAIKDRKNRLEIGYGWEGPINDARAGDLLRAIVPELRAGKYAAAAEKVVQGVDRYVTGSVAAAASDIPAKKATRRYAANPPPAVAAPRQDPNAVWWSWFGIVGTLVGIGMAYRGRIIMTSVPHLTVVHPWRYSSSGGDYDSGSSYSSGGSSSSSSDRGGGSFGGGGASGSW